MKISAQLVKELRERTGAGMMECKSALVEAGGDLDTAVETLRKKGAATADKKAGRIAAEGVIAMKRDDSARGAVLVEVNCETDFVGGGEAFQDFAAGVASVALSERPADVEALLTCRIGGETVDETRRALIAKLGENISIRRFSFLEAGERLGHYLHRGRIGTLVALTGGDDTLGKDLAMHVASAAPMCVSAEDVPQATLESERRILAEQAADSGKPPEIIEKMVEGRLRKFLAEITLLGQPFVKDPDLTVGKLLGKSGATVEGFLRFEVGEGIEKKADDFAREVMEQVRGSD